MLRQENVDTIPESQIAQLKEVPNLYKKLCLLMRVAIDQELEASWIDQIVQLADGKVRNTSWFVEL